MKKIVFIICLMTAVTAQAQEMEPTFDQVGDQIKVTYYYEDGTIFRQGFFKNKKLSGQWTEFDCEGNRVAIGYYENGAKVGTWFYWKENTLRQVNYRNNIVYSVNTWRDNTKLAVNK